MEKTIKVNNFNFWHLDFGWLNLENIPTKNKTDSLTDSLLWFKFEVILLNQLLIKYKSTHSRQSTPGTDGPVHLVESVPSEVSSSSFFWGRKTDFDAS